MLNRLAKKYGCVGYHKIGELLETEGWRVNHKKVERLWRQEGLQLPERHMKCKRHYHHDASVILLKPRYPNHIWSVDIVHDRPSNSLSYKMLPLLKGYTREALCVTVATRMVAHEVLEALTSLILERGLPTHLRSDNDPEFIAEPLQTWLRWVGIKPIRILPGSHWENDYNERFNGAPCQVPSRSKCNGPVLRGKDSRI